MQPWFLQPAASACKQYPPCACVPLMYRLQIESHIAYLNRSKASLQRRLASLQQLLQDAQQALAKAAAQASAGSS